MTAEQVLALVAEQHGTALTLSGRCPGGEVGAYLARAPDGAQLVCKWTEDADDRDHRRALVDGSGAVS